jgi:hypothetical protein
MCLAVFWTIYHLVTLLTIGKINFGRYVGLTSKLCPSITTYGCLDRSNIALYFYGGKIVILSLYLPVLLKQSVLTLWVE